MAGLDTVGYYIWLLGEGQSATSLRKKAWGRKRSARDVPRIIPFAHSRIAVKEGTAEESCKGGETGGDGEGR